MRSTFYPTDAFLSRELLTFYALDLLDMCQVVNLLPFAFVSTLQTAGRRFFFSTGVHFLAVLKQIFEQFAVPIDSNSLMFKKKHIYIHTKKNPGFYFPLNFWRVLSHHIISYPMHQKQRKGEGTAHTAHIDQEPSLNTHPSVRRFRPFVLSLMPVFLDETQSCSLKDVTAIPLARLPNLCWEILPEN